MTREIIATPDAPKAIGIYSQGVRVGRTVYLSGQVALDPATGQLVPGDVEVQVRRVFDNLKAVRNPPAAVSMTPCASRCISSISALFRSSTK